MLHLKLVTGLREGPLQDVCPSNNDIHDTTHQLFMEDYKHPQDYVTDNSTTRYFLKYLTDNITLANVSICGMYQLKFSGMCSEYFGQCGDPCIYQRSRQCHSCMEIQSIVFLWTKHLCN